MTDGVDTAKLGALIRQRREIAELTMRELSRRAGLGESTVHRIEHGPATKTNKIKRPTPSNLARVLVILGIPFAEIAPLVDRSDRGAVTWAEQVEYWMHNADDVRDYAEARRAGAMPAGAARAVDLILLHEDGSMVMLQARTPDDETRTRHLDELARAARRLGYMVTVPQPSDGSS